MCGSAGSRRCSGQPSGLRRSTAGSGSIWCLTPPIWTTDGLSTAQQGEFMTWTTKRRKQLEQFRQLLVEVSAMNHGSGVSERILRCEKLAEALFSIDLDDET